MRRSKYWFRGWDEGEEGDRLRDLRQVFSKVMFENEA